MADEDWGWVELTKAGETNRWTVEIKVTRLLFAKKVECRGARLKDDKYFVKVFVRGKEEPVEGKLNFKDGDSVEGVPLSDDEAKHIVKVGVSIPPGYE